MKDRLKEKASEEEKPRDPIEKFVSEGKASLRKELRSMRLQRTFNEKRKYIMGVTRKLDFEEEEKDSD